MTSPSASSGVHPDALASQAGWIRALARELVGDAHLAEDLAQDTLVSALERGPRDPRRLRGWLATVLRNRWRQDRRGAARRAGREAQAAREEALESAGSIVARASQHGALVAAVLALEEPYRTALLLRYFDGLPPRAIAERLGLGPETVKSHLKRGLARLRAGCAQEHGADWRAWVIGVLPGAGAGPGAATQALPVTASGASSTAGASTTVPAVLSPTALSGVALVNSKVLLGSLAVVAAGVLTYVASDSGSPLATAGARAVGGVADAPSLARRAPAADPSGSSSEGTSAPEAGEARSAVPPPVSASVVGTTGASETWTVRGRVLSAEAQPLAGVRLRIEGDEETFVSDGGGGFTVETSRERGRIVPAEGRWVAVHEASFRRGDALEPTAVLAPAVRAAGRVVDGNTAPVPLAHVALVLPETLDTAFGRALDASRRPSWTGVSDEDGRFVFERLPRLEGARLQASAEGYERALVPQPTYDDEGLLLVLGAPSVPLEGALTGRVLGPDRRPVPKARVALGLTSVLSDLRGEFRIDLARAVTANRIVAVKEGHLPAVLERPGAPEPAGARRGAASGWPDYVELTLGGPPLAIAGRVLRTDGTPVGGARVWLADPTPFGVLGRMPTSVENLAAGAELPRGVFAEKLPKEDDPFHVYGSHTKATRPSALWYWVRADGDGRFELEGLQDRAYRLRVLDRESLLAVTSDPVAAGSTGIELELPVHDLHRELVGRVVTTAGHPIPKVEVELQRTSFATRARFFGGVSEVGIVDERETVRTDRAGRFRFEDVPREGMQLVLTADAILPRQVSVPAELPGEGLEVVVDARCHLRVSLAGSGLDANGVAAADADGEGLPLLLLREGSTTSRTIYPLVDGRTPVLSVSSSARSLRFLKDGVLVHELPIEPLPGEVLDLRL